MSSILKISNKTLRKLGLDEIQNMNVAGKARGALPGCGGRGSAGSYKRASMEPRYSVGQATRIG